MCILNHNSPSYLLEHTLLTKAKERLNCFKGKHHNLKLKLEIMEVQFELSRVNEHKKISSEDWLRFVSVNDYFI